MGQLQQASSLEEGWLACLAELRVLEDNPAWAKTAPAPEFLKPLAPYSPIILPGFDEEEYVNRPKEDEVVDEVVDPSNEAAQLADEAGQTTVEGTGEDATQDLLPEP